MKSALKHKGQDQMSPKFTLPQFTVTPVFYYGNVSSILSRYYVSSRRTESTVTQ